MTSEIYIIELNKSMKEFSEKLVDLINDRNIKDIKVNSCTLKEYQRRYPLLHREVYDKAKLIFLGDSKAWKAKPPKAEESEAEVPVIVKWKYEKFGCRIGWKGKNCVISAHNFNLPYRDYSKFRTYCLEMENKYRDVIVPPKNVVIEIIEAGKKIIRINRNKSTYRALYSTLIHEFMDKHFDDFINCEDNGEDNNEADEGLLETKNILRQLKEVLQNTRKSALLNLTMKQAALCHTIIHSASIGCSIVGFIPIPVADVVPITSTQVAMVVGLGEVFKNKITKSDAKIILKTAAAPIVGRALAKSILVLVPGVGWTLNGAIAGAITEILGWTIANDFATKMKD